MIAPLVPISLDVIERDGAGDLSPEDLCALALRIAAMQGAIAARLCSLSAQKATPETTDDLLSIDDAAKILGRTRRWFYRTPGLPFIRRPRGCRSIWISHAALRTWIKDFISVDRSKLTLLFESFGFKNGAPLDADLVFDVRCLPNPHYEPTLRPLTGRDAPVVEFLEAIPEVERMYADIYHFVASWLPDYARDNRNYLTVALGCTGGQHRSVYLVERLARTFRPRYQVLVRHRELEPHERDRE